MVIRRTLAKIEELKERPHHERRTIAIYWAVGVAAVLVVFWGFFAVRSIGRVAMQLSENQNTPKLTQQTASAAAATDSEIQGAPPELSASSTNGYIDLIPSSETRL